MTRAEFIAATVAAWVGAESSKGNVIYGVDWPIRMGEVAATMLEGEGKAPWHPKTTKV